MTIQSINPETLPLPENYAQVVVATGTKLIFVSGQEPEDVNGDPVGPGDLAAQTRQVFDNIGRALSAAGARRNQVAKITFYVVNYKREDLPTLEEARVAFFGDHKTADVVLGVQALSHPDYLIEIDAFAVVDG